MEPIVIGIRFQKVGKVYHFDASSCRDIQVGDFAVLDFEAVGLFLCHGLDQDFL